MKPQHFIMILFAFALYWMYQLYNAYWMPIFIGSLLAISTANIHKKMLDVFKNDFAAAFGSSLLLAILLFAPLGYFLTTLTIKLHGVNIDTFTLVYEKVESLIAELPDSLAFVQSQLAMVMDYNNLSSMAGNSLGFAATLGKYSASFLKDAFLIIIFYFFAQYYGKTIVRYLIRIIRLPQQDTTLLSLELSNVMSVVFYSIIATATLEGALFGIMISFIGYNGLLFGIMYGIASLIPIVGGALMWTPFMIYELSLGHSGNALFITLYSIIIISIIADTFIKPVIIKYIDLNFIKSSTKINELLIFFSILAGLTAFGFWGMVLGPAITAFFMALLKLYDSHDESYFTGKS
ncbi:AI-2E family transporter [Sulfurimonas sp. MAG313]|nr:AI-2E family transporter [Sulfurimonas sp. MAG313]MDF1882072.1 AI-2E family transporter [Sulfurimonas sp. MAG313]